MPKNNDTNINIKTSTLVTGLAILIIGMLGWSLKSNYDSMQRQITKQWEKINNNELAICSSHSAKCKELK